MAEKVAIDRAIVETLQVDGEGLKHVKTLNIADIMKLGVVDVPSFLAGVLDAENNEEFNESSEDYVKGYKYGKTGAF